MTSRRDFTAAAGLAALSLVGGCGTFLYPSRYRFRMTVEVSTPQGLKTGSSIMEVSATRQVLATSETHPISAGLRGEAVTVDLPSGPLFALLTIRGFGGPLLLNVVTDALNPLPAQSPSTGDYMRQTDELAAMPEGARQAILHRDNWPEMVRFGDLAVPKSLEVVDPEAAGVTRVSVTVTRALLTSELEKRLGWLNKMDRFHFDGNTAFSDLYPKEANFLRSR